MTIFPFFEGESLQKNYRRGINLLYVLMPRCYALLGMFLLKTMQANHAQALLWRVESKDALDGSLYGLFFIFRG